MYYQNMKSMFSNGPFRVTDVIKRLKNKYPNKKSLAESPLKQVQSSLDYADAVNDECKCFKFIIMIGI
jgi:hypothetical protein